MCLATLIQNVGDEQIFREITPNMWQVSRERIVKFTQERLEISRSEISKKKKAKARNMKSLKKYQSQKKTPMYKKATHTGTFLDLESDEDSDDN